MIVTLVAAAAGTLGVLTVATAVGAVSAPHAVRFLAVGALLVGLLVLGGGGRAVRSVANPIGDLVDAASRIEEGDYTARVRERGPREARALARAFNAMSTRLEATDTQRRTFLADVTHELRTPLAVIRGQLEGVLDGVYPADPEHLQPILDQTENLEHLVDDLRTLALTETGSLSLVRESVDLGELVDETILSFRANADAAGVSLRTELPADLPLLNADPVRTRSVLANLLANAIRHTPSGGTVTVDANVDTGGGGGGDSAVAAVRSDAGGDAVRERQVAITVRDTGSGIPPEILPRVFDRFVKAPGSAGSGLGLSIARDLVVAHGGTISAESEPGKGTAIRFTLPTAE